MAVDIVIGFDSLALVFAIGLSATQGFLTPAAGFRPGDRDAIRRGVFRLYGLCLAALWLTSLTWLWVRTAVLSGQSVWTVLPVVPTVLFRTHFGAVWWLRAAAVIWATLTVVFMAYRGSRWRWSGIAVLGFGLAWVAASRSAAGHAAADGDWTLREGMDWLHLISVSVWGGSLMASLVLIFPRLSRISAGQQVRFASRFSLLATWALAGVVVSGIYSAWQMLPAVSALWNSHYGRLLSLKLFFVAGMVTAGSINHYRLVPGLQPAASADNTTVLRRFRASVVVETALLLVVIAITAMLLGSAPPGHSMHTHG